MYQDIDDPWRQTETENLLDSRKTVAINWVKRIVSKADESICVSEIGCGFGHITATLTANGIDSFGVDISPTAVKNARKLHPGCNFQVADFSDFNVHKLYGTNVFIMAEITWYVLPKLRLFINDLIEYRTNYGKPIWLIHLLTTYAEGKQKYGTDYFKNIDEIIKYFDLVYLEYGYVVGGKTYDSHSRGTYFVAQI